MELEIKLKSNYGNIEFNIYPSLTFYVILRTDSVDSYKAFRELHTNSPYDDDGSDKDDLVCAYRSDFGMGIEEFCFSLLYWTTWLSLNTVNYKEQSTKLFDFIIKNYPDCE